MEFREYNDDELVYMIKEDSIEAKDILFEKYSYLIDIIIKKYTRAIYALGIDMKDIHQEAFIGFTTGLNTYDKNKDSSLKTFISLCVERKIQNIIKKASTNKNRLMVDTVSLEKDDVEDTVSLMSVLGDENSNPLAKIIDAEKINELQLKIRESLSDSEFEVYSLLVYGLTYMEIASILEKEPKQVDNSIQRIRSKVRKVLDLK